MPAVKEKQVENTTINDFVQIFTTVQRKIKKREIVYLQNLWDLSFIQMLKGKIYKGIAPPGNMTPRIHPSPSLQILFNKTKNLF